MGDSILASLADGQLAPGNIDLHNRPVVHNPDGSISTVRSMSVGFDDGTYLIPTVAADGSRILDDEEAIDQFMRTGQHLGVFSSSKAADRYANRLHEDQASEYGTGMPPIEPYPPRPSILSEMPSSQNPSMQSLPDEYSPEDREAILRFAQDIQSPEYRQAMLMALSGAIGAPAAQEGASRGILDRASSLLRGSPEESALSEAANAAYKARYTPDEWAALMRHWEEFNQPAKIADYVPTRAAAKDTAAPIEGILNALKFSLGFDRPKTAAMSRMAQ